jgi:hypothetical protein
MSNITRRSDSRKAGAQLDQFSSPPPPAFVRTTDWVAARLTMRFGSVEHAVTVARLAGIGSEATR